MSNNLYWDGNIFTTKDYVLSNFDGIGNYWVFDDFDGINDYWVFDKEYTKENNKMNYYYYDLLASRVYMFALPGVGKDNIKIRTNGKAFYIEAKRDLKNKNAINENTYGFNVKTAFKAEIKLGKKFDADKVNSWYKDGVLYVEIPFKDECILKEVDVK